MAFLDPFERLCRGALRVALAALVFGVLQWAPAKAASAAYDAQAREGAVKAVFLFNFTRFVDWPEKPGSAEAPLVIGVWGRDPFGTALDEAVKGEGVSGRRLALKRIERIEDALACDEVFISASEEPRLARILGALEGKPVLTVSDIPGFAARGGMIGLVPADGRVKIQINPEEAKAAGLRISSKLLRPAEIVSTRRKSNFLPSGAKNVVAGLFEPKVEPTFHVHRNSVRPRALDSLPHHGGSDAGAPRSGAVSEQRFEREDGLRIGVSSG